MNLSDNGINLIQSFEGLELASYQDTGHVWTIGYGHTKGVKDGQVITKQQALVFLLDDTKEAQDAVNHMVNVPLTQNQYDALVSFVFNIGRQNFRKSSLLRYLNLKQYHLASEEFDKWVHDAGRTVRGLVNRRRTEKQLFLAQ